MSLMSSERLMYFQFKSRVQRVVVLKIWLVFAKSSDLETLKNNDNLPL